MKVNLNDKVVVRLTDYGVSILKDYALEYVHSCSNVYSFQLWELCNIFGKYLYLGNNETPFEDNSIFIKKE